MWPYFEGIIFEWMDHKLETLLFIYSITGCLSRPWVTLSTYSTYRAWGCYPRFNEKETLSLRGSQLDYVSFCNSVTMKAIEPRHYQQCRCRSHPWTRRLARNAGRAPFFFCFFEANEVGLLFVIPPNTAIRGSSNCLIGETPGIQIRCLD